jgi:fluoride exporter
MPGEPDPTDTVTTLPARRAASRPAGLRPGVLAAIAAGGALGSVARYEVALALPRGAGGFPWATFVVNVTGSFVLGVVATLVLERWPRHPLSTTRYVRPFVGIGVCGGYTTWSTFMTDTAVLVRDGRAAVAILYVVATLAAGLLAAVAGVALGRHVPAGGRRRA